MERSPPSLLNITVLGREHANSVGTVVTFMHFVAAFGFLPL